MGLGHGNTPTWLNQTDSGRTFTSLNRVVQSGLVLNLDAGASISYPGSGTTWSDISGNGNTGTLTNGPTYNGANYGSIAFDGVDDYVTLTNASNQFDFPGDFTVGLWIYPTQYHLTYQTMLDTYPGGVTNGWIFTTMNGSTPVISWYTQGSGWQASSTAVTSNDWNYLLASRIGTTVRLYKNATQIYSHSDSSNIRGGTLNIGVGLDGSYGNVFGRISNVQIYKDKGLTATEILQNYNALKGRFPTPPIPPTPEYETLTYTASGNLTVTGNGTNTVDIFKTSGGNVWDNQAYSSVPFTAPCTIEFNKQAASGDNGVSYAMIGWNADPLTNASYDTLDYASYPYRTDVYQVYHNGTLVQNSGSWSTSSKFYIVYGTDGSIKHYNGSALLYSVNYGTGNTVYVDSSFYSVNATFGGFSNIKVIRSAWNGTTYFG